MSPHDGPCRVSILRANCVCCSWSAHPPQSRMRTTLPEPVRGRGTEGGKRPPEAPRQQGSRRTAMDDMRFDGLTRSLCDRLPRRSLTRLLAGGATAGLAGWLGLRAEGQAKRKRTKKRNVPPSPSPSSSPPPPPPPPPSRPSPPSPTGFHCPSSDPLLCPPTAAYPQGVCAPADFHCCTVAQGGGACAPGNPQCCAPTVQDPAGLCIPNGSVCCTSEEGGGFCDPGETCCPPCPGWPNGLCAFPGYPCWMSCKSGVTGDGSSEGFQERKTNARSRTAATR